MRKSLLIVFLMALMMMPPAVMASDFKVTFNNDNAEKVITKLEQTTGYGFVCRQEVISGIKRKVDGTYTATSLKDLLNDVVRRAMGLDYEIVDNTVILRVLSNDIKGG